MEARDIIIKPVVTEKSVSLMEHNKYVFRVALSANKIEIKKAVEDILAVLTEMDVFVNLVSPVAQKIVDVNTVRVKGKVKRMGRYEGKTSDYKKAIVQLAEGDSIEIFEGM